MKRKFTLIAFIGFYLFNSVAQAQTVYASIASGAWNSGTVWETYPNYVAAIAASPGGGTASTSTTNPSGTHNVLIRNGHTITMGANNRGCKSIIIQAGGKLWANEATARRLQIGAGGTGFSYPLTDTVRIDGILGGTSDGLFIESGVNAQNINISGNGSIDIGRIRTLGGGGSAAGGILNLNIEANINLWVGGNYGLSIVYNPTTTDNYTLTIKPGKTVTMKTATTTFHNSQTSVNAVPTSTYGNYTYNIQGTLDFSANTNISTIIAPNPASSKITLNIDGGTMKIGSAFKADTVQNLAIYDNATPPNITGYYNSTGILDFKLVNGGTVDASLSSNFKIGKTTDGAGGVKDLIFAADATSSVKVNVGSTEVRFPVGLTGTTTPNTARLTNTGASDVFTVSLKSTFDNAPPTANVVNRQWTINEAVAGGSVATVALSWVTADQAAGFSPTGTVSILRWNGTAYDTYSTTVSGTGTANDPYVATTAAGAVTSFSPFIVASTTPITAPVSFISTKAYVKSGGVQVEWTTAEESGIYHYAIEKSTDGSRFIQVGVIASANRNAASYSWFDATPSAGANYYRIKAVEADGSKLTTIMKVTIGKKGAEMVIASNPVKGNMLNLQLSGMEKGSYVLSVYNNTGQKLFQKNIVLEGSSLSQGIVLPGTSKGLHTVTLQGASSTLTQKIIIE